MLKKRLDSIDLKILQEIQANARLTNSELATRVNLSASPCLARVKALEEAGVISQYVTLLDPLQIGLNVSVFLRFAWNNKLKNHSSDSKTPFETIRKSWSAT